MEEFVFEIKEVVSYKYKILMVYEICYFVLCFFLYVVVVYSSEEDFRILFWFVFS